MTKIIILGATSSIGRELVDHYARMQGVEIMATGRRADELEKITVAHPRVRTACFDLTEPDCLDHLRHCIETLGGVDILFFNAGTGIVDPAYDPALIKKTLKLNVIAFAKVATFALHYFTEKVGGQFVATASVAGLRDIGCNSGYSSSNAFIVSYMEGLRQKACHDHLPIVFTTLMPAFVDTPLINKECVFWMPPPKKPPNRSEAPSERKKGDLPHTTLAIGRMVHARPPRLAVYAYFSGKINCAS